MAKDRAWSAIYGGNCAPSSSATAPLARLVKRRTSSMVVVPVTTTRTLMHKDIRLALEASPGTMA